MAEGETQETLDCIELTVGIISAYVSNNSLPPCALPGLITRIYSAITVLTASGAGATESEVQSGTATPAQIKKSITPDALISFVDGKPYKTLKRHLSARGLDFNTYRARYGLPADYPAVSPNYAVARSQLAQNRGLGWPRQKPKA